jgi:hypothetical protein
LKDNLSEQILLLHDIKDLIINETMLVDDTQAIELALYAYQSTSGANFSPQSLITNLALFLPKSVQIGSFNPIRLSELGKKCIYEGNDRFKKSV